MSEAGENSKRNAAKIARWVGVQALVQARMMRLLIEAGVLEEAEIMSVLQSCEEASDLDHPDAGLAREYMNGVFLGLRVAARKRPS
jgi:hypothetical protein